MPLPPSTVPRDQTSRIIEHLWGLPAESNITAQEIADALQITKPGSVSAVLSVATHVGFITRSSYRAPGRMAVWIVRPDHGGFGNAEGVVQRMREWRRENYPSKAGTAPAPSPAAKAKPVSAGAMPEGILLSFEIPNRDTLTLTFEEARALYSKMSAVFD